MLGEFTITRTGTTRDVVIIESTNAHVDWATVDAAARFQLKPRVIDGEPAIIRAQILVSEPTAWTASRGRKRNSKRPRK